MQSAKQEFATLRWLLTNIKGAIIKNCEICEDLCSMAKGANSAKQPKPLKMRHNTMYIDLYHVELLYGRLLTIGWSDVPFESIQSLLGLIGEIRERFLFVQKLWERIERGDLDGPEVLEGLVSVCKIITMQKEAFVATWDDLADSLSQVKLVKINKETRKRKSKT